MLRDLAQQPVAPTVGIACSNQGVIEARYPGLFAAPGSDLCRTFLDRLFGLEEVHAVEIHPGRATALIRCASTSQDRAGVLRRLARALRGQPSRNTVQASRRLYLSTVNHTPVKVSRYGTVLSTWDIVHELPGRMRLRHPSMRGRRALAHYIEHEVTRILGIRTAKAQPLTASLLVVYDPDTLAKTQLLHFLERILLDSDCPHPSADPPLDGDVAMVNASLGIAALGQFWLPAVLPLSAFLLVASNGQTFKTAWQQLRQHSFSLPGLYVIIIAITLGTGQFFTAALMTWLVRFWPRFTQRRLLHAQRRLLASYRQHQRFVWLCRDDVQMAIPIEDLQPQDRVAVRTGDAVPVDGHIVSGIVALDERLIQGVDSMVRKGPGDRVYAGSVVLEGDMIVEVGSCGDMTIAATIGKTLEDASTPRHENATPHGEAWAHRAVSPTLATAGVGLMVGDVTTALAILRPDYATGPRMAGSIGVMRDIATCALDGIIVRDATVFDRCAEVDLLVFDHHPALEHSQLEVAEVMAWSPTTERDILGYVRATSEVFGEARTQALEAACRPYGLASGDSRLTHIGFGVTLVHGGKQITVHSLDPWHTPGHSLPWDRADDNGERPVPEPLVVSIDGQLIGGVRFRHAAASTATDLLRDLHQYEGLRLGLLSHQPDVTVAPLAMSLGTHFHHADLSPTAKAGVVRQYQEDGYKVAFIGDCQRHADAAQHAHVAISFEGMGDLQQNPAQVVFLQPQLHRLNTLWTIVRAHANQRRTLYTHTLIPNLVCAGGALFLGFPSLASVLITNLGTLGVYARGTDALRRLLQRQAPGAKGTQVGVWEHR